MKCLFLSPAFSLILLSRPSLCGHVEVIQEVAVTSVKNPINQTDAKDEDPAAPPTRQPIPPLLILPSASSEADYWSDWSWYGPSSNQDLIGGDDLSWSFSDEMWEIDKKE